MNQKHNCAMGSPVTTSIFPGSLEYEVFQKDKFTFRIPKNTGFFFDEFGCWAYVIGNKARIGVTDLIRQSLNDIIYFMPPKVGAEIGQFEEMGTIESAKAVFAIASPVTGKVIAVNEALVANPDLMNQNPYEVGWIAEVEVSNFENARRALLDFAGYLPFFKDKMEEFRSK
jgi:glycine cleavage system H protein